jgi:hypothetical protein
LSSARSSALPPIRQTGHHRHPDARFDDFPSEADPGRSLRRRHRDRRKLRLRHAFGRKRFGPIPGRIRRDASRDRLGHGKRAPLRAARPKAFDTSEHTINDAIANSIANTALLIGAKLIVNFTQTGNSTKRISKARPCCPIISVTNNRKTCLARRLAWGVYSRSHQDLDAGLHRGDGSLALKIARDLGIEAGAPIIIAGGTPTGAGKTNFMRIVNVNQIKDLD